MEPTAAGGGVGPPPACAPGEHAAQLAAKLAAGAQALCSMAEAAAAAAAAEQLSEGETFDHQVAASGEQEAEGRPAAPDGAADVGGDGARACSQCGQTRTTTWRRHPLSRDWACNSCYHKASRQLKKRDQGGLSAAGSGVSVTLADAAALSLGGAAEKRPRLGDAPAAGAAAAAPPAEQYLAVIDMQHQVLLTHVCMLQRQVSDLQQAVAALPAAVQGAVAQQRPDAP